MSEYLMQLLRYRVHNILRAKEMKTNEGENHIRIYAFVYYAYLGILLLKIGYRVYIVNDIPPIYTYIFLKDPNLVTNNTCIIH